MKSFLLIITLLLLTGTSCKKEVTEIGTCNDSLIAGSYNFHALIKSLPADVVSGLTKDPGVDGALGENKNGYFHVRFQMDIGFLASYAVYSQDDAAFEKFILSTEYSFARQKPEGDFLLVMPSSLQNLGPLSQADLSSGTSFFLSALGSSLVLLNQSSWFNNLPSSATKKRLTVMTDKFQLALNYLKTQKDVLSKFDKEAPNRLLFNALAFYSMGSYLKDNEAKAIGIEFIELALSKQNSAGFFIEGGGFDSSYNGVSTRLGLILLGILENQDDVYIRLKKALSCSVQWQASRVLTTGEISVQGNTRVYPGGEQFLGSEKQIAWTESLLAFYFTYSLSSDEYYNTLAKKLETFYN